MDGKQRQSQTIYRNIIIVLRTQLNLNQKF